MDSQSDMPKKRGTPVVACDYCRRLHEKCSGTQPCDRCVRRGKQCTYSTPSERAAKIRKTELRVSSSASGGDLSEVKALENLKKMLEFRTKGMKLIEATLRSKVIPDGAKLAKYQSTLLGGQIIIPDTTVPEFRVLPLALGPPENIPTADDLLEAIKHLIILCFGSLPHSDLNFATEKLQQATDILRRLTTEYRGRVLTDMSTKVLPLRTFLSHLTAVLGDHEKGSEQLARAVADWEARDRAFDNDSQNNMLAHMYSLKWSFYGDEHALHLARSHARDGDPPGMLFFEIGLRHAMRRLHTDHPETIKSSQLLLGDCLHYDKALEDMQHSGRVSSGESIRIASFAVKSILHYDGGLHDDAAEYAQQVLELARTFSPEGDLSFHIPASICIAYKVTTYMNRSDIAPELKLQLSRWRESFHGVRHWEQMVEDMFLSKSLEQPMHVKPPVFRAHNIYSESSSSDTSPNSPPETVPYTVPDFILSRLPPVHNGAFAFRSDSQSTVTSPDAAQMSISESYGMSSDNSDGQNPQLQAFLSSSGLFPLGAPPMSNWPTDVDMLHDHSSGSGEILFDEGVEAYFDQLNG